MSPLRSTRRERDAVHRQLTALLATGGPLAVRPADLDGFLTRDLLDEVTEEYRALTPHVTTAGRAVIITSGPPGAGKSRALDSLLDGHRRIDPDEAKNLLLARLEAAGLLAVRHGHLLRDGRPVSPGELSWWVHVEGNTVADNTRLLALANGENFAVEGTLQWDGLLAQYSEELADNDYEHLTVLDIEVPRAVAVEQARQRWWGGRNDGSALGGRFMADDSFDRYYPDGDAVSVCATRARELYEATLDVGVDAQVALVSRDAAGKERTALVTTRGVERWPVPGPFRSQARGAVCVRCGRPLHSDASIVLGMGAACAAS